VTMSLSLDERVTKATSLSDDVICYVCPESIYMPSACSGDGQTINRYSGSLYCQPPNMSKVSVVAQLGLIP
jgi:hypothetical protein